MSKTTITINGEECMILPAPKGAFVIEQRTDLYMVHFIAMPVEGEGYFYALTLNGNKFESFMFDRHKYKGDNIYTEISPIILDELFNSTKDDLCEDRYEERYVLIDMYNAFKSHDTSFSHGAIMWFKQKFKEHNITKSDFNVFE